MKIVCNRDKLNEAIAIVSRAVATKSNLASIEGILLIAENDTLTEEKVRQKRVSECTAAGKHCKKSKQRLYLHRMR